MTSEEILTTNAVSSWKQVIDRVSKGVAALTEDKLEAQIAPNRNRVIYVVGHLIAVNDRLFELLRIGNRLYPALDEVYLTNPDRTHADPLSLADLKNAWTDVHGKLTAAFEAFTPAQWLERHNAVSADDFVKEPERNRLAVLLSRTNHVSFHGGQLVLVK